MAPRRRASTASSRIGRSGATVVIVSASFELYLEPIGRAPRCRRRTRNSPRSRATAASPAASTAPTAGRAEKVRRLDAVARRQSPRPSGPDDRTPTATRPATSIYSPPPIVPGGRPVVHCRRGRRHDGADRADAVAPRRGAAAAVVEERARVRRARRRPGCSTTPSELRQHRHRLRGDVMVASGTYYWNDLFDLEADRAHPEKKRRPIASGQVPIGLAADRRHVAARRSAAQSPAFTGRWQTVAVVAFYGALDAQLHGDLEAHRRARPDRRRLGIRAPCRGRGDRHRRRDVQLVRAGHHVRVVVHRHRQALRRAPRARRRGHARRGRRSGSTASTTCGWWSP